MTKLISENLQLADKVYFNTGKLSPKVREIIVNKITGGDNYTKIISDIYYAMIQQEIKTGQWAVSAVSDEKFEEKEHYESKNDIMDLENWKKVKSYYEQLTQYNKNVFPIKNFDINKTDDVWGLIRSLNERQKILNNIKKLPSVAIRNLKDDIKIPRDSTELQVVRNDLEYILANLSYLSNRNEKSVEKIYNKIFKSNTTFKKISSFVDEKKNLLGGYEITKDSLKEIVKNNSYDLKIIHEKGDIVVIEVTSPEGIKEIGCNSLWCFTYGHDFNNMYKTWNNHSTNDYVYVIVNFSVPHDEPEFMMVLIKPLPTTKKEKEKEENSYILFTMDNDGIVPAQKTLNDLLGKEYTEKLFLFGEEYIDSKEIIQDASELFRNKYTSVDVSIPSFQDFYKEFLKTYKKEDNQKIKEFVKLAYEKFTKNPNQLKLFELKIRHIVRNYLLNNNS